MRQPFWHATRVTVAAAFCGLMAVVPAEAQRGGGAAGPQQTQPVRAPRFEYVGPMNAGRVSAAAAVAGKPGVYYAGAASGGGSL